MVLLPVAGGSAITLSAGTSGNTFTLAETAANTAAYASGLYSWIIKATKAAVVEVPASGQMRILPAPGSTTAEVTRLQADLTAVDTALRDAVTDREGVLKYSFASNIGSREVEFRTLPELQAHRAWLVRELDRARSEAGFGRVGGWRRIKTKLS